MRETQIWLVLIGFLVVCATAFLVKKKLVEPAPATGNKSIFIIMLVIAIVSAVTAAIWNNPH